MNTSVEEQFVPHEHPADNAGNFIPKGEHTPGTGQVIDLAEARNRRGGGQPETDQAMPEFGEVIELTSREKVRGIAANVDSMRDFVVDDAQFNRDDLPVQEVA